eukprot:3348355-Pleurochrysis_carterae.AAC.1
MLALHFSSSAVPHSDAFSSSCAPGTPHDAALARNSRRRARPQSFVSPASSAASPDSVLQLQRPLSLAAECGEGF